mgnify:CR=1|jgi:hypothetical protein
MKEYIALFVVCIIIILCVCGLYIALCGECIDEFDTKTIEEIDTPL